MQAVKPVGRNAPAMKYDILSALGVMALSGDKHRQRLVLRLMVLITTRYNWQKDELSIGRAEIARLWSVDERTVKREMAKLRSLGWLDVKRAGVKGRVTVYRIDLSVLLAETRDNWDTIGPDFAARMGEGDAPQTPDPNVIPFQRKTDPVPAQSGIWGQVLSLLQAQDPGRTAAWFGQLSEACRDDGVVTLMAPTRFMADYVRTHLRATLLGAYGRVDPSVRDIRLVCATD